MKYIAKALVKNKISASANVKNKIAIAVNFKTQSPISSPCPQYNLIDGGNPDTIYVDINGFNLIDGGNP
jgi:hypothetical protein